MAPAAAVSCRRAITAHKGWFTRQEERILDLDVRGNDSLTSKMVDDLAMKLEAIFEKFEKWIELPAVMLEGSEPVEAGADREIAQLTGRLKSATAHVMNLPAAYTSSGGAPMGSWGASASGRDASSGRVVFREQQGLKPPVLLATALPVEIRHWMEQFAAYFAASNMSLLGVEQQRAYLYNRREADLATRLRITLPAGASLQESFTAIM
jgi:hypothetical protein